MNHKQRYAVRVFASFYLFISIFIFVVSYNREFRENNYRFNFSDMSNPEHALLGVIITVILFIITVIWKKEHKLD